MTEEVKITEKQEEPGNALDKFDNLKQDENEVVDEKIDNSEVEKLQKELDEMPKPWKNKLKERAAIKKKIKEIQGKVVIQDAEDVTDEEIARYINLQNNIGYKKVDLKKMSKTNFVIEKAKMLAQAERFYNEFAMSITNGVINFSKVSDSFKSMHGFSDDMLNNKPVLHVQIKKIMIQEGFKPISITGGIFGNPWTMLALTIGTTAVTRIYINKKAGGIALPKPIDVKKNELKTELETKSEEKASSAVLI